MGEVQRNKGSESRRLVLFLVLVPQSLSQRGTTERVSRDDFYRPLSLPHKPQIFDLLHTKLKDFLPYAQELHIKHTFKGGKLNKPRLSMYCNNSIIHFNRVVPRLLEVQLLKVKKGHMKHYFKAPYTNRIYSITLDQNLT